MIEGPLTGVWGWPWHGLASANIIQPSGKSIDQPQHCHAWLIDIGLPAITLTAAEEASATANDYEWRNYALISGGRVYDTALPAESFIHVDTDNKCWLITLSYTYTAENQVNITATIKRFGLFGYGELGTVTKTDSATCTHIELTSALGNPVGNYEARSISLSDVWTNGTRALVGVWLKPDVLDTIEDLFSVIEVTIGGAGGTTGIGLSLSATESLGQASLTYTDNNSGAWVTFPGESNPLYSGTLASYVWIYTPAYGESCPTGTNRIITPSSGDAGWWKPFPPSGYGGGYDIMTGRHMESSWARCAYYSAAGVAKALRLVYLDELDHVSTGGANTSTSGSFYAPCDNSIDIRTDTGFSVYWDVTVEGHQIYGYYIYELDTLIDKIEWRQDMEGTQFGEYSVTAAEWSAAPGAVPPEVVGIGTTYTSSTPAWSGNLSGVLTSTDAFGTASSGLANAWRRKDYASGEINLTGPKILGVQGIDAHSAGLYLRDDTSGSARTYGLVSTPVGAKSYSGTSPGNIYFAWQRKTGDFAFSTSPICYV